MSCFVLFRTKRAQCCTWWYYCHPLLQLDTATPAACPVCSAGGIAWMSKSRFRRNPCKASCAPAMHSWTRRDPCADDWYVCALVLYLLFCVSATQHNVL
jgi:hypothetical protein